LLPGLVKGDIEPYGHFERLPMLLQADVPFNSPAPPPGLSDSSALTIGPREFAYPLDDDALYPEP